MLQSIALFSGSFTVHANCSITNYVGCAVRTKWLKLLKYCGVFGAHGAPYRDFCRALKGSLKTH
ncbi:hypothetical protein [Alysiella crassa]|uniref:hypothetical protein n=1 Tax=Alysiella crassa TaxID=153491 RepID=UPI000558FCCD|nr:hypothetical protein [Alysiella crassa]UOP07503.1 hypothetical protein LVJ80_03590 [Alysiella crassa]